MGAYPPPVPLPTSGWGSTAPPVALSLRNPTIHRDITVTHGKDIPRVCPKGEGSDMMSFGDGLGLSSSGNLLPLTSHLLPLTPHPSPLSHF